MKLFPAVECPWLPLTRNMRSRREIFLLFEPFPLSHLDLLSTDSSRWVGVSIYRGFPDFGSACWEPQGKLNTTASTSRWRDKGRQSSRDVSDAHQRPQLKSLPHKTFSCPPEHQSLLDLSSTLSTNRHLQSSSPWTTYRVGFSIYFHSHMHC